MKFIAFSICAIAIFAGSTMAQRPMYAGSGPIGRPDLASRFRDPNAPSTEVDLNSRLGEDGSTERIPVDALGDYKLVNRLNEWPRENRPFWLLNAEAIEASRNQNINEQLQNQQDLQSRNNFNPNNNNNNEGDQTLPIRPNIPRSPFAGGN